MKIRDKKDSTYGKGRRQGYIRGVLHAALSVIAEIISHAALSKEQVYRLRKASSMISEIADEIVEDR